MHSSLVVALNVLFIRRQYWQTHCLRLEGALDSLMRYSPEDGAALSAASIHELARCKARLGQVEDAYLDMLAEVGRAVIEAARATPATPAGARIPKDGISR